jgi:EAL domain-containing protein (putative c-di-GMP-specific phosphodiesterase class I)/CheY-like chemotaxis protein
MAGDSWADVDALSRFGADEVVMATSRDRSVGSPPNSPRRVVVDDVEGRAPESDDPVLIIDDDPAVRDRFATALENAGTSTIEAADGDAAVSVVEEQPISAVVLSNDMPDKSGASVLRTLRERTATPALPALVVTSIDSVDALVNELAGGADDYLTAPVAVDDLVARVHAQQRRNPAWTKAVEPLRSRLSATESLVGLDAGAGIEDIATAICDALITETGGPTAGLYMFASTRRAVLLAGRGLPGRDAPPGLDISEVVSSYLFAKARRGPWAGQAADLPIDSTRPPVPPSANDRAFIVAPIVRDDHPIGVLFVGGPPGTRPLSLGRSHFATLLDFAATAGMLLGADFLRVSDDETAKDALRARYGEHRYCTHFQPVVELVGGLTVGYEALTRWDDGAPADAPFAEARRIGMSIEIEIETLRSALIAATELPGGGWLSVNLSPQTIMEYQGLPELLAGAGKPIVVELTEHDRIDNYDELRARIAALGQGVRVAVDDAGAGYSTLSHVLALEPAFVKLDLSWIHGIDRNRPRQAMITGLVHFANETGCELIAEGVETVEELEVVRHLGVTFGQGFFMGPAALAADLAVTAEEQMRKGRPDRRREARFTS